MALIIEDGTGIVNANSYATYDEAYAYAQLRGKESVFEDNEKAEQYLISAVDYLETITDYEGVMTYVEQFLQFPRAGLYIDGLLFDDEAIPQLLKTIQIQLALAVASGINLLPDDPGTLPEIKREKIGPIDTEYFDRTSIGKPILTQPFTLLEKLRVKRSTFQVVRV